METTKIKKPLELKIQISEVKNLLVGLTSIINTTEKKIDELEDIAIKSIQIEAQTERCFSNNEQSLSALWDNIMTNIHSIGVQKDKKGISVKKIFDK